MKIPLLNLNRNGLLTFNRNRVLTFAGICTKVYENACNGVGRDLRIILLEALRVAAESGIETSDVAAFSAVIEKVKGNLGRKAA